MVFLPPCPYGCRGMGQPLTKQNASEAGYFCVASCCPFGSRPGHRAGPADVFKPELDVDGWTSCVCDLSLAGGHHVASRDVCLPSYSTPAKVAGGIDHDHCVSAFAGVVFRCLTVVRAAEGNATTAGDSSQ